MLVLVTSTALLYFYKDTIIAQFISKANEHLNTPVQVGKITVSSIENFPNVSIDFAKVKIKGSLNSKEEYLLEADYVTLLLNPIKILEGNYSIEGVKFKNAICIMQVDKAGNINYDIVKKQDKSGKNNVAFNLSKIELTEVHYIYENEENGNTVNLKAEAATSNLYVINKQYNIEAVGDFYVEYIGTETKSYVAEKGVAVQAAVIYDDEKKTINISPSTLSVEKSKFLTYGDYVFGETSSINLFLESKDTNLAAISALLPKEWSSKIQSYESKGEVYFDLNLKGDLNSKKQPALEIHFGLKNAQLLYPPTSTKIENATAEGYFINSDFSKNKTAYLELKNISGKLDGKNFEGGLSIKNFNSPYLELEFNGQLMLESLMKFYPTNDVQSASGEIDLAFNFTGNTYDLKNQSLSDKVKTSGELSLNNVNVSLSSVKLPITQLNGQLLFNNNDIAINGVSGFYGKSDFLLNGLFKNVLAYMFLENEPIGVEAELKSKLFDLDELLLAENSSKNSAYTFRLSPKVRLKFNTDIKTLKFRRFRGTNIKGEIAIREQILNAQKLSFNNSGGYVQLSGIANAQESNIAISSKVYLKEIPIDSAFYIMEDFNQDFITHVNFKGKVNASVDASMLLNEKLNLINESLEATILTTIKNGELNNFAPMQRLAKYVDEEKLDHLTFSDIETEVFVKDKTIYLPEVEVASNVTTLKISGTHTFDQVISYKVVTPLKSEKRVDKDEAFGAIEEDASGRSMLFLKIEGTTSDYKVSYDKHEVKQKILADLKKEVKELKDAFKNKGGNKKKAVELEADDYFEWEENDN